MPIGDPMGGSEPLERKGVLTRVWMSAIPVSDLDAALDFYMEALGLKLRYREGNWAELGPNEPLGKVALYVPEKDDARRPGGPTGVVFSCDSIFDLHRELVDQGVVFKLRPQRQPWGGLLAVLLDEDGNEIMVLEHPDRYHA
ncbi:MAG: VOC family protein [Methanomassiliicoccales archaeon]|nr:VOC family protein [Methanomassiliicoccales archaeon]